MKLALTIIAAFLLTPLAGAKLARSYSAKAAFARAHACPSTHQHKLPCPGWIIDHRIGLCVGGPDSPENMRWMTIEAAKKKDKWECKPGWEQKLKEFETKGGFNL